MPARIVIADQCACQRRDAIPSQKIQCALSFMLPLPSHLRMYAKPHLPVP